MKLENEIKKAEQVLESVAMVTGIKPSAMLTRSRKGKLPYSRQLAIYMLRQNTDLRCHAIAQFLGWKKSHNGVCASYKKVRDMIRFDDKVKSDVMKLEAILNN